MRKDDTVTKVLPSRCSLAKGTSFVCGVREDCDTSRALRVECVHYVEARIKYCTKPQALNAPHCYY